jgi:hypothetical protein
MSERFQAPGEFFFRLTAGCAISLGERGMDKGKGGREQEWW